MVGHFFMVSFHVGSFVFHVLIDETKPKLIKGKTPIPKRKQREKKINVPPKISMLIFIIIDLMF
jgi:hypothetical protein